MGIRVETKNILYCEWCQQSINGNSIALMTGKFILNFHTEEEKKAWKEEHERRVYRHNEQTTERGAIETTWSYWSKARVEA